MRPASWCSLSWSGVVGVLALGAVTFAGTACSDALTKGAREPASSARASQVSLDPSLDLSLGLGLALERVSVARARLDALSLRDDDWPMRAELLARALYAVALAHMARARELDRAVLQLAPPADRAARREGAAAELPEAEAEGELELARLVDELRPSTRVQHLAPAARAHVRSHDAALLEAARLFRESRLMAPSTPRSGLGAAEARALERLGQRTHARVAWLAALSGQGAPADRFEAWVAFADHFEALGRVGERERALERAAIELGRVPSSERDAACLEARAHATHIAPAHVCRAVAPGEPP